MRSRRSRPDSAPLSSERRAAGFTLVEIALALGVVAFALTAILGLVPVALDAARDSREQVRAALISQLVFGDLRAGTFTNAPVTALLQTNGTQTRIPLDLSSNLTQTVRIAYDAEGRPTGSLTAAEFANGFSGPPDRPAAFLASLRTTPHPSIPGLARVELSVEQPAGAPQPARRSHAFVTQIAR